MCFFLWSSVHPHEWFFWCFFHEIFTYIPPELSVHVIFIFPSESGILIMCKSVFRKPTYPTNSVLWSSLVGLQGLQLGDIDMVVGTHSLISEKIEYSALRIAVIDEQHRFGVIQRGRFNSKVVSCLLSMAIPWFCEKCTNRTIRMPDHYCRFFFWKILYFYFDLRVNLINIYPVHDGCLHE